MKQVRPGWEIYERMIARMIADQSGTGLCVTPNANLIGKISGVSRQIDVLIDERHNTDNTRRIVVDAKHRKQKVDVKDVESFLGLMKDASATHGYLVTSSGYSKAAEKRAQMHVSIRIVGFWCSTKLELTRLGSELPLATSNSHPMPWSRRSFALEAP